MKAAPKDTGIYECKLSNPEGSCSSSAHASVTQLFKPPVFSQKISDQFSVRSLISFVVICIVFHVPLFLSLDLISLFSFFIYIVR